MTQRKPHPTTRDELDAERKALERVRKLVKLSTSPNENEARTSALKACQLIEERGFVVAPGHAADTLKKWDALMEKLVSDLADLMVLMKKRDAARKR